MAAVKSLATLRTTLLRALILTTTLALISLLLAVMYFRMRKSAANSYTEEQRTEGQPAIVVFSTLFPSPALPQAGIFIRERMFRVAKELPITVVSPRPGFPFQGIIRLWKTNFRPPLPKHELQLGVEVIRPVFLSFPGILKRMDGYFLALANYLTLRRLRNNGRLDILDAHFAYPEGFAAVHLGRWLGVPVTITLRGTESRHFKDPILAPYVTYAVKHADRIISVSRSLLDLALQAGMPAEKGVVIGNGVDHERFRPISQMTARTQLGFSTTDKILISVGGLVERKGFHRVIEQLPKLLQRHSNLHYLIVGGAGPEGDFSKELRNLVASLQLTSHVHFLGSLPPDQLISPLSAADVFVLATRNEGWANVFLEAMACGLPVVTTDVGGNREVVSADYLGKIVPFGDGPALASAIDDALANQWDRKAIRSYAQANSWASRISVLLEEFRSLADVGKHGKLKTTSNNEMFGHNQP